MNETHEKVRPAGGPGAGFNHLDGGFSKANSTASTYRNETERALDALQSIPPDLSRDEWAKAAFAAQAAGVHFLDFDRWSQGGESYRFTDCKATWNSCLNAKPDGPEITAGTLFYMAKQHGWRDTHAPNSHALPKASTSAPKAQPSEPKASHHGKPEAAPAAVWERCKPATAEHPYIARKHAEGAPLDGLRVLPEGDPLKVAGNAMAGALVVPAIGPDGALQSLQLIPPEGDKMNLPGCRMTGAAFTVGSGDGPRYLCEGIGQAWACHGVTGARAVVCFGWGNVATIAEGIRAKDAHASLVLVPDAGKEEPAERIARKVGACVAMMPEGSPSNFDAGDLLQRDGPDALRDVLNAAQSFEPPRHPLTVTIDLDFEPHPPRWILPGLIAEGVTILAGMRGVGKTTALLPLAAAAAGLCEESYPLTPKHWRHAVYVTEDAGQAQRILAGLVGFLRLDRATVAERFHLVEARRMPALDLVEAGDTLRERYSRTVGSVTLPPLVVLDTQSACIEVQNENDNAEAGAAIAALKQRFAGLPVWLVAHVAKASAPTRGNLTARGAGAFEADVNAVLYAIEDGGNRYLLTGKTRFEPRWRELLLESHLEEVTAVNAFGDRERLALRWSIAKPLESGERAQAAEEAKDAARKAAQGALRQTIRDAVQIAQQGGNPLSRNGAAAKAGRNRKDAFVCIECLLAEQWLIEVDVPANQRRVNSRKAFLVNVSTSEHETLRQGGTLPPERLAIPESWRKPDSTSSRNPAAAGTSDTKEA